MILCTWCGTDEFVDEYDEGNDEAWCFGPGHLEPRLLEPRRERAAALARQRADGSVRYGIAYELGLYDDLPPLLRTGKWAETGVIEHRYGVAHPPQYAEMLARWGHVAQSPRRYSVTSFIGSTLGHLSRATNVTYREGPGTGFFAYNRTVGYWTLEPVPADTSTTSWEAEARSLGLDPATWPLAR